MSTVEHSADPPDTYRARLNAHQRTVLADTAALIAWRQWALSLTGLPENCSDDMLRYELAGKVR